MKFKKIITAALALSFVVGAASCGKKEISSTTSDLEKGNVSYPLNVEEKLTVWVNLPTQVSSVVSNYGETAFAKNLKEATGVEVEYIHPTQGQDNALSLLIASGDMPDIVIGYWPLENPSKCIEQNVIYNLNDYLDDYSPNFKKYMSEYLGSGISGVCTVTPGVLGTTGMETADTVKCIVSSLRPDLVITIDALAAADIRRVATTIQISDAGIQPGAGVGNDREGINRQTLGVPVIAVGVPTVIDARSISDEEIPEELLPLMVTTKDIDLVIKKCARTIADGINLALHENITHEEIMAFTG